MYGMKKMKREKMADGGKPDFLDLDKDGNKTETMKSAAKGMLYGGAVKEKKKNKMYVGGSVKMRPAKQMSKKSYSMNRGGTASLMKPTRSI